MTDLATPLQYNDASMRRRYEGRRIPMNTFFEAYIAGKIDVRGDLQEALRHRGAFVNYRLTTEQVRFIVSKFIPSVLIHSRKMDHDQVTAHYDRGDDFFHSFLGDVMIYTSAYFKTGKETLEEAQENKLEYIAQKIQLGSGQKLLDIGCGWGTLVRHMADRHGADATGVTISKNQAAYGNERIAKAGIGTKARVLELDYRDIPKTKFDRVTVLEMAEHVGVRKFQGFLRQVSNLLVDDGIFFLQIAGLRRYWTPEDFTWGMFMSKYIFPGADASLPLGFVTRQLEKAGFEIHSVENIGIHYSLTIDRWYKNWLRNSALIRKGYGEKWFRLWETFLAWSVIIAEQGGSTCFQIVSNKNTTTFDRHRWVGEPTSIAEHAETPRLRGMKSA